MTAMNTSLLGGIADLRSEVLVMDRKIGRLNEESLRSMGSRKFGESFAIGHTARGLDDLVYLLSLGDHIKLNSGDLDQRIDAANTIADALKPAIAPLVRRTLGFISSSIPELDESLKKTAAAEAIAAGDLEKGVGILIGISKLVKQDQWKQFLVRLKPVLSNDHDDKALHKILRSSNGPGVLLANVMCKSELWKQKKQYQNPDYVEQYLMEVKDPFLEFEDEAEFDMRGCISFVEPYLTIEVGEIKSSVNDLPKAKKQLANRLQLLLWATKAVLPMFNSSVLIGHVLVPRSSDDSDRPPTIDKAGIQYRIHRV
eukprot:CAMPEP_0172158234 /NCGR_PEP_ID=MMETSP1050-20130122/4261_1 /TAXON_ID=233186 /ORGANISM="Cryptomonas curvata, Strain CCAP979/52" /LENGTH=312 /DNA_ID=CAMNT_0012827607 /DNA_START=237 /DNA_END=1175 /DNA_ORIENTATION=-